MGAGHVLRCLALAQAWCDEGGEVTFAMRAPPAAMRDRLSREGMRFVVLAGDEGGAGLRGVALREQPHLVLLDGYHLGPEVRAAATSTGAALVMIDDNREADTSGAALVINPGLHADGIDYGATPALRGPTYALLRRELRRAATRPAPALDKDRPVLVTLGGSDPLGLTVPIVERLVARGIVVHALVGGLVEPGAVEALCGSPGVIVHRDVDDVVPIFDAVGWAVSAAGGTAWELAALGHPVASIAVASNQRAAARALASEDGGSLGPSCDVTGLDGAARIAALDRLIEEVVRRRASADETRRCASAARAHIDGQGAVRVARAMRALG